MGRSALSACDQDPITSLSNHSPALPGRVFPDLRGCLKNKQFLGEVAAETIPMFSEAET